MKAILEPIPKGIYFNDFIACFSSFDTYYPQQDYQPVYANNSHRFYSIFYSVPLRGLEGLAVHGLFYTCHAILWGYLLCCMVSPWPLTHESLLNGIELYGCCVLMEINQQVLQWFEYYFLPKKTLRFDRHRGTMSLHIQKQQPSVIWTCPFKEVTARYSHVKTPYSTFTHLLYLIHEKSGKKFVAGCYPSVIHVALRWKFLQQYMDPKQALPDTPELESVRALDKMTQQVDQVTKRPSHYWRHATRTQVMWRKWHAAKRFDALFSQ